MLTKPSRCFQIACPLAKRGQGYAPACGPKTARLAIVGEALGQVEALYGEPFIGKAGTLLDRLLRNTDINREEIIIDNTVRCRPPNNWLVDAPWEGDAIHSCAPNLEGTLNNSNIKVVIPMGATAIRRLLGISSKDWKSYKKPMENFHGTVHRDPLNRFWIVPTYHPSFLLQGNMKFMGVVMHDLLVAKNIMDNGWEPDKPTLKIDPPVEWFREWVEIVKAKAGKSVDEHGYYPWLAVDIETPEKEKGIDESEVEVDDPSYIITRCNFGVDFDLDLACTVPWHGPYVNEIVKLLADANLRKAFWNANYDRPRLNRNGARVCDPWFDIMDAWHMLQSSLPRGLGFVAPFYSRYGAWKHLSGSQPGKYAAVDGLQTTRIAVGVEEDLRANDQWDTFVRHASELDRYALKPAEDIGIGVDIKAVRKFQKLLERYKRRLLFECRRGIPEELIPLEPKNGYKTPPKTEEGDFKPEYFEIKSKLDCYKCLACSKTDVTLKHRCKERKFYEADHKKKPFEFGSWEISRWYTKGEFNPLSPQQVLGYIKFKGHKPGKAKKTMGDSADVQVIEKLSKKHKDPFYKSLLSLRKVDKVKGTYVDGAIKQMDENGRIHSVFTNKPSTWRLSSQGFNLQNVVSAGKREDMGLGEKFRQCIVPAPGCVLLELDFAGIEAVQVGWFANDPSYIRLSKMSAHAFMASHMTEFKDKPAQLDWPDDELTEYLAWIKHEKKYKKLYNKAKRVVHGSAYALSVRGLHLTYPEDFPTIGQAQKTLDLYFGLFPKIKQWQAVVRQLAHEQHFLGGTDHPFRYKHWFWNIFQFTKINKQQLKSRQLQGKHCAEIAGAWYAVTSGKDYKRAVAYYPQSTAGGNIREAMLKLFKPGGEHYIGDVYYGKTPFRMPIHDSLVLEVPKNKIDYTLERAYNVMTAPIMQQECPEEWGIGQKVGDRYYLTIDAEAEVGKTWGHMEEVKIDF
jgi:uracil-DNA glycosylase family 4